MLAVSVLMLMMPMNLATTTVFSMLTHNFLCLGIGGFYKLTCDDFEFISCRCEVKGEVA